MRAVLVLLVLLFSSSAYADLESNLRVNTWRLHYIDMEQTFDIAQRGHNEINPFLRPFVERNDKVGIGLYFLTTSYFLDQKIQSFSRKEDRELWYAGWMLLELYITGVNNQPWEPKPFLQYTWKL